MGGGNFEFHDPRASSSTELNRQKPENVWSTEVSDVVKPSAKFSIVDLKDYDIANQTMQYFQVNHVNGKLKIKNAVGEKMLNKAQSIS